MQELKELTGKKNVLLTSRGNKAIYLALQIAKEKGFKKLFVSDQGGWYTYSQYGKKLGFEVIELKTDRGLIDFSQVQEGCLIFNDMPAYAFLQNKQRKEKTFYIADITGSIGTRKCKADILVCSFGKHKVINLGTGGMIALDEEIKIESDFEGDEKKLLKKIKEIPKRLRGIKTLKKKVIHDLRKYEVLKGRGLNIIVKYKNKEEKEKILYYCKANELETKECPMKIKINEKAISIELQNR